jgi:hypothetical protein
MVWPACLITLRAALSLFLDCECSMSRDIISVWLPKRKLVDHYVFKTAALSIPCYENHLQKMQWRKVHRGDSELSTVSPQLSIPYSSRVVKPRCRWLGFSVAGWGPLAPSPQKADELCSPLMSRLQVSFRQTVLPVVLGCVHHGWFFTCVCCAHVRFLFFFFFFFFFGNLLPALPF